MIHESLVVWISILVVFSTMWIYLVHCLDSSRFLKSLSSRIMSCTSYYLPSLLLSTISIHSWQLANVVEDEQTKQYAIHPTLSTWMNNTRHSIHHLASSCISSPREIVPLSPREISASVSLLDCEWRNMRDSIVMESILSSKGQFASSKLNINCDTWARHE